MNQTTAMKACRLCRETKPLDDFHRMKSSPDGRQYRCKTCALEVAKRYDKANIERRRISAQARRNENPEDARQRLRDWRALNPDRDRELRRIWRNANPEKASAAIQRWWKAHPDKRAFYDRQRRAILAGATIGPVDLDALWTGTCGICREPLDQTRRHPDPLSQSLDHIIPLILGGSHEQSNLQWTHLRCNIRKGARLTA